MELALLLAAGLRDWVDFGVIAGILMLNASVGWYQEKQAEDVVASLKGDIAMKSTVVRDGQEVEIKARELVPGDIVSPCISDLNWRVRLTLHRSSSMTAKSSPRMRGSSALMTTPMVTRRIRPSYKHVLARQRARKVRTTQVMTTKSSRNTVLAMHSSLSISLP